MPCVKRCFRGYKHSVVIVSYSGLLWRFRIFCFQPYLHRSMQQHIRVLAGLMVVSSLTTCLLAGPTSRLLGHSVQKRSFYDLQCKGVYDKSIFARLDLICDDCYNLFREPQLHQLCRKNCFTSDYFKGCLEVLLLQDEMENIQTWIKQLHGAEPEV